MSTISYFVVNAPLGEDVDSEVLRLVLSLRLAHVEVTKSRNGGKLCLVQGRDGSAAVMTHPRAVARILLEHANLGEKFPELHSQALRLVALRDRQKRVLERIATLERGEQSAAAAEGPSPGPSDYSDQTARVKQALEKAGVSYKMVRTWPDYYDTPLAARAKFVGASSEQQMLKMVLLKNDRDSEFEPNSLAVLVQYATAGFDTKTINVWFRETYKRSKSKVNFRVDPEGEIKTGFKRNGLSPFGSTLVCPIILDSCIAPRLQENIVWLGGGEFDVKIGVPLNELIAALKPVLLKLT